MPGFDGTGPVGFGPMTGWGRGRCARSYPKIARPVWTGFGRGRGWRNMYYATGLPGWARAGYNVERSLLSQEDHIKILEDEAKMLQRNLENINKELDELRSEENTK